MARTINRTPLSVNTDVGIDYRFFNYNDYKGIVDNKNFVTADQETFEDAFNVYVNEESILCSRPSTKLYTGHGLTDILKIWHFSSITVYLTVVDDIYKLAFVENGVDNMLIKNVSSDNIAITLMDEKIFVFSPTSIDYYDIFKKQYYNVSEKDLVYVPTIKSFVDGIAADEELESPNVLTSSHKVRYTFTGSDDIAFNTFVGTKITFELNGNIYKDIEFVPNMQTVFVKRNALLSDNNFALDTMLGENTNNFPLISISENGSMLICNAVYEKVDDIETIDIAVESLYTTDGYSYKILPKLTNVLSYPKISRDGTYAAAFKADGLYFYSLVADGPNNSKRYTEWKNVLIDLKWKYAKSINFNNCEQYDLSPAQYNKQVGINGDFIDYDNFVFTANVMTFTGLDENVRTEFKHRYDPLFPYAEDEMTEKPHNRIRTPITASSPSMMTVVYTQGKFYESFQDAQIGCRIVTVDSRVDTVEIYNNTGTLESLDGGNTFIVKSDTDTVTLAISSKPSAQLKHDTIMFTVATGTPVLLTNPGVHHSFECDLITCIEKDKYETIGKLNVKYMQYGYVSGLTDIQLSYTVEAFDLNNNLIYSADSYIAAPTGSYPNDIVWDRVRNGVNKVFALESLINSAGISNIFHISMPFTYGERKVYGRCTPNIVMRKIDNMLSVVAVMSNSYGSINTANNITSQSQSDVHIVRVEKNTVNSRRVLLKSMGSNDKIRDKHSLRNGLTVNGEDVYICTQNNKSYITIDSIIWNGKSYQLSEPLALGDYDSTIDFTNESTLLSKNSTAVLTNRYFYDTKNFINLLFECIPIDIYFNTTGFIAVADIDNADYRYLYTSSNITRLSFDVIVKGTMKPFVPEYISNLSTHYFAIGNKLYNSSRSSTKDFKLYIPENKIETFESTISNIHPISKNELAVFFEDAIYYISDEQKYKTKFSVGCRKGADIITTFDGKNIIFPSQRGLVAMSYQDFVASTEQTLTYLSDAILKRFLEFNDSAIKLYQYKFWIICYKLNDKIAYVLDVRNNSWWRMNYDKELTQIITVDYEPLILLNKDTYKLDYNNANYKDDYSNNCINWLIKSQKLHLNAINYYKHIMNLTMSVVDKTDDKNYNCNAILSITNYRKATDKGKTEVLDYDIDVIRTFVKRLNYSKVSEFQFLLQNDKDNAMPKPLSLSNISIKYNITGVIR